MHGDTCNKDLDTIKTVLTTDVQYVLHGLNKATVQGPEKHLVFE